MNNTVARKASRMRAVIAICNSRGIDDDARHDLQMAITGKSSLKDMTLPELSDLLDRLNQKGPANPADEWRFVFRMPVDRQTYGKKIYRLAQAIGKLQETPVPVMSKAYIEGISRQMTGTDHPLQFCDCAQLHKIVQALEVHLKRKGG